MTSQGTVPKFSHPALRTAIAFLCAASLAPGPRVVFGQAPAEPATIPVTVNEVPKIPNEQLDSLVSPIALYPDPLLIQTLVASTYPLEIIQLEQWMEKNKSLKGQALAEAVAKQPWDPSIQSMVAIPDVVKRLAGNIQWTTELGNAFLAQEVDVMDAVQRMRVKAQGTGNLQTSAKQVVETKAVEDGKEVIVIEQADPKVIYVPSYDPVVVYGAPVYPYPGYSYPGYVAGAALTLGAGIALGAAWGGSWGYNCGWGRGGGTYVNVNRNNTYVNASRTANVAAGNAWRHNPQHRGGAPYGDRGTAGKYGGRTAAQRPGGVGGVGGAGGVGRPGGAGGVGGVGGVGGIGGAGGAGRPGGAGGIGGIGGAGGAGRPGGVGGAGGIGSAGGAGRPGGAGGAGGIGSAGGAGRPGGAGGAGGASRPSGGSSVGNRSVSPGAGHGSSRSAFSGGGSSGGAARASSSRGASSMGGARSAGGGGMSRGGGGASRGGGGGGRR